METLPSSFLSVVASVMLLGHTLYSFNKHLGGSRGAPCSMLSRQTGER